MKTKAHAEARQRIVQSIVMCVESLLDAEAASAANCKREPVTLREVSLYIDYLLYKKDGAVMAKELRESSDLAERAEEYSPADEVESAHDGAGDDCMEYVDGYFNDDPLASKHQLIEQIRRAHSSAQPRPSENPAWANCHFDCGILLAEINRLERENSELREGGAVLLATRTRIEDRYRAALEKIKAESWQDDEGVFHTTLNSDRIRIAEEALGEPISHVETTTEHGADHSDMGGRSGSRPHLRTRTQR